MHIMSDNREKAMESESSVVVVVVVVLVLKKLDRWSPGGGILPTVGYTGRLRPKLKGLPSLSSQYIKG